MRGLVSGRKSKLPSVKQPDLFRIERFATEIPAPALTLAIPWPPSVNGYWQTRVVGKRAMVFIGKEGTRFRLNVAGRVLAAGIRQSLTGRLSVEILLTMPDRRARDVDNILKATLDALQHARVFDNDNQIDRLLVARAGVQAPGHVEVRIAKLGE